MSLPGRARTVLLALAGLPLTLAAPGAAQDEPAAGEPSCTVEIGLLCPGAAPGSEALRACLREHGDALPEACRAQAAALAAPPSFPPGSQDLRSACREDFETHCAELGGEAPRDAVVRCLGEHADQVSEACRSALLHPKRVPRRPRVDCVQARRALCPLAESEYEREQCLAFYRAELPPECRPRRLRPGR